MSPRETSPIANDARKGARRRRLTESACAMCGASDPAVLVAARRTSLEFHHAAGSANEATLGAVLCRNCHAVAAEAQRDAGADLSHVDGRHALERLAAALRSLGSFFALLAEACAAWADSLAALVIAFDAGLPGWRTIDADAPP
jgi:hypothetical protein